jgi:hypothetical protein
VIGAVLAFLATAALAVALAGLGETLCGRRSVTLGDWNRAFLVGGGALATLLFPASLALGARALDALAAVAAGGFLAAVARRLPRRPAAASGGEHAGPPATPVVLVLIGATVATAVGFAVLNLQAGLLWDGFQIWSTKALLLYENGRLTPELWPASHLVGRAGRVVHYPNLVPLLQALQARVTGAFSFEDVKPLFQVFHLSLLVGTWEAAFGVAGRTHAWFATCLVVLLPALSTGTAAGGYADMPQAAAVAGVLAAAANSSKLDLSWRAQFPWLVVALTTVKSEGTILAVIAAGVALLAYATGQERRGWRRLGQLLPWLAVVGGSLVLRLAHIAWNTSPDPLFVAAGWTALGRAAGRFSEVVVHCGRWLVDPGEWGVFWLAALPAAGILAAGGRRMEAWLSRALITVVALYSGIFLFSTWPVALHVEQAYTRLLSHVAPLGAVILAAALARPGRERREGTRVGREEMVSTAR